MTGHETIERWAGWIGGLAALVVLAAIFYGIWLGLGRSVGRTAGRVPGLLRTPVFYILASIGYFGLCVLLWRPISLVLSTPIRIFALVLGAMLYFPGLGLVLWGRLALGRMYFVSSSLGAQLQKDHELVTHGLYALVRHPMYLGILMVGLGGILLYRTWTFVFFSLNFPVLLLRARREEEALGEEFGEEWMKYRQRVPAWLPTFMKTSFRKIDRTGGPDGTKMDSEAER